MGEEEIRIKIPSWDLSEILKSSSSQDEAILEVEEMITLIQKLLIVYTKDLYFLSFNLFYQPIILSSLFQEIFQEDLSNFCSPVAEYIEKVKFEQKEKLEAFLSKTIAWQANLRLTDLRKADLSRAYLREADLSEVDLSGADLSEADLSKANLRNSNLSKADLRGTNLVEADLRGTNLVEADLRDADLRDADLRGADLSGTNLCGANLCGAVVF